MKAIVLCASVLVLSACSKELNTSNVREFVDDADKAFLAGHANDICSMRSDDFELTSVTFKLAEGRTVSGLAEAEAFEADRNASGDRSSGEVVKMNAQQYCLMAIESRAFYRRATLARTQLDITVESGGTKAVARAHYVVKEPVYAYGDSSLSVQDQVEKQIATLQTETDEESVIVRNGSGKLVFTSTKATSKQFRVPKARDARL
jgi:hypothetical protein